MPSSSLSISGGSLWLRESSSSCGMRCSSTSARARALIARMSGGECDVHAMLRFRVDRAHVDGAHAAAALEHGQRVDLEIDRASSPAARNASPSATTLATTASTSRAGRPRNASSNILPRKLASIARTSSSADRQQAQREIVERLDEDAAEPEQHDRPVLRIDAHADDQLESLDHLLHEQAVAREFRAPRRSSQTAPSAARSTASAIAQTEQHAADFGLMNRLAANAISTRPESRSAPPAAIASATDVASALAGHRDARRGDGIGLSCRAPTARRRAAGGAGAAKRSA